jgi:hypothetical protein
MIICFVSGLLVFATNPSRAQEPGMPGVSQTFSPAKEKMIDPLAAMDMAAVFTSLRSTEFFDEEELLNKAIYKAFCQRSAHAVAFALGVVRSTQIQKNPAGPKDFYIAKQTLLMFPDQSIERLVDLYNSGGPKVRKNVIEVMGQMAGESIRQVLIDALDDESVCEETSPESTGEPLRICDAAYNQLVLRCKIENVPRVIGSIHTIEMRNHHIRSLKGML